jgi:hypothetical protein
MITLARQIAAAHKWPAASGEETVRTVFEQLSQNSLHTDSEMAEGYRQAGLRLVAYARKTGLFDVPEDYRLEVTVTPPPLRSSIEGAAYYPAPPSNKPAGASTSRPRTTTSRSYARNITTRPCSIWLHEGFLTRLGLQGHTQYRTRLHRCAGLPLSGGGSSSMWQDSMAAEGWALYWRPAHEPQPTAPTASTRRRSTYQLRGQLYRDLRCGSTPGCTPPAAV